MTDRSSVHREEFDPELALAQRGDVIALLGTSSRVLDDCRFPNGAVVIAPGHLPSYPRYAPNGLVCEPGLTLALAIAALDELGRDERASLLAWVAERASGFEEDGVLRARYAVNGSVLDAAPDRIGTGLLLTAIANRAPRARTGTLGSVLRLLAAGLAVGRDRRVAEPTDDPPDALLAAGRWAGTLAGLQAAERVLGADEWGRAAEKAADALAEATSLLFADEGAATLEDELVDSTPPSQAEMSDKVLPDRLTAALTLAWPFTSPGHDLAPRCLDLAERLTGLTDLYWEGERQPPVKPQDWPNPGVYPFAVFWLAAAQGAHGRTARAEQTFTYGLSLANGDGHFPERVGRSFLEPAACPDLKAHLAFILAAGVLGRIKSIPRSGYTASRRPRRRPDQPS